MSLDKLVDSTKLDAALTYEANKIRSKTGSSAQLTFDLENNKGFGDLIDTIVSKGGEYDIVQTVDGNNCTLAVTDANTVSLETKSVTVTSNGTTTISPSTGYDGISSVSLTTNVPEPPANFLYWDFTFSESPTGDQFLVSSNATVLAHKSDAKARLIWMYMGFDTSEITKCKFVYSCNTPFYWNSSTSSDYKKSVAFGTYGSYWTSNYSFDSGGSNLPLYIDSTGSIKFLTYSKFFIPVGNSRLIFMW